MRYLSVVIALVFVFSAAAMAADESQKAPAPAAAKQGPAIQGQGKEIEVDHPTSLADEAESGVNSDREMPSSETYDENTGLPDVVPSDREEMR